MPPADADIQRYCVVTLPRTGSSYLGSRLSAVPHVVDQSELFHRRKIQSTFHKETALNRLYINPLVIPRLLAPLAFLDRIMARSLAERPDTRVFGFKLFVYHSDRVLRAVVADSRYNVVFLHRANKLAQYGSDKLARRSLAWGKHLEKDGGPRRVAFDPAEFDRYCARAQGYETYARSLMTGRPFLDLEYEDINRRFDEVVAHISGTRRAAPARAAAAVEKQHQGSDLDRFSNPDAVLRHLRGTPWAAAADLGR